MFAALSDGGSCPSRSQSPPDDSPVTESITAESKAITDLRDCISDLQRQIASLRSDVPHITNNPLRNNVDGDSSASLSLSAAFGGSCSSRSLGISSHLGSSMHTVRRSRATRSDHARKVPLPAEIFAGTGMLDAGDSSSRSLALHPKAALVSPRGNQDDGAESDDSASSFGLSCGLPGLSHEVAETITHLSAAETLQVCARGSPAALLRRL
jgi:hypothetical protein